MVAIVPDHLADIVSVGIGKSFTPPRFVEGRSCTFPTTLALSFGDPKILINDIIVLLQPDEAKGSRDLYG